MVTALIAAMLASKPVRDRAARVLPIDPDSPVHSFALVLAVILLGTQLSSILFAGALAADQALSPLTLGDLISQEVPFLILAAAGVGLYIRRNPSGTIERLGLVFPKWWHVAIALAAAGVFYAFSVLMDWLAHAWTPDIAHQVDRTTQHLFGGLATPVGIAALALAPGLCEEVLFRGALQPRLGLFLTALLFASIHTQYGVSLDALAVFAIAIGLGLIRKYTNTTASCICHVAYNLAVGINIGGVWLGVAIAIELGLVGLSGYAVWSNSHRSTVPAAP